MKKTVLEKENKYNEKKTKNLKVLGVATIYTLAISIGLSAAAFALFNKLKNIELPTETPIESVTPIETVTSTEEPTEEPTETPIESNIPTETGKPTETIIPTETPIESQRPTPTPSMSEKEYWLYQRYQQDLNHWGEPIIFEAKVDNEKKIIIANIFQDRFGKEYYVDYFSQIPLFYMGDKIDGIYQYPAIGAYKGKSIEIIKAGQLNKNNVQQIVGKYGFDITKYSTVADLWEWYVKSVKESERIPQMPFLWDFKGYENIRQWNEDYTGPYLENCNTDYANNFTLSASSKESLNNKLIASGLLKQDSNTNIVDYQKILQKRA